jgi:hypothetical protein
MGGTGIEATELIKKQIPKENQPEIYALTANVLVPNGLQWNE